MNQIKLVTVYEGWNSYEAHILCNMLEDAGINARVASTAIDAVRGRAPFQKATCPIFVAESDADVARSLIRAYEQRIRDGDDVSREAAQAFCYHCGEAVQTGQTPCPSCSGQLEWNE